MMTMMATAESVSSSKKWLTAVRPWSFPASSMAVIFGTSLAVVFSGVRLDPFRFLLSLLTMVVLHAAANMLSDVFDFRRELDKDVTPVSGAVVRGWLSPAAATRGAAVLFAAGIALGLFLAAITGWTLLVIGGIGIAVGAFYTLLKYHALGDLAVFLNFGILGALGAWVVQTKSFSWVPVVWTVPMSMLVIAILHANNWRDAISDSERKIKTVASILGDKGSEAYYAFLVFGSMALVFGLMIVPRLFSLRFPAMPWTFAVVGLALPRALALWGRAKRRRAPRQPLDFVILDGATAQYNLLFGLLCTAAVWLQFVLKLG
jgi:1,4-dihydroxy-2-naphthoate octaprenyltransferase